ncbi:MAG: hypothetical protein ACJ0IZ_00225 [Verrucomicrobiales bacterium]|nr:hypothetical protein [Verrucomicrobiales bacterium]
MIADYFWKVIFLILLIIGLNYWFDWRDDVNSLNRHLNALTEIIEKPTRKGDKACRTATFQSIYHLREIEKVRGEKFEVRAVIEEIRENVTDISREEMGLIVDVLRENYNNARNFGLFKNEQSLEALEEGRGTKIMAGPWRGEPLELGHFISPEINDTIQFHFSNRLILPETVKAAMEFADITKDVRDRADRMKRAKVLDVGSCDSIIRQYNTLRELSSRN